VKSKARPVEECTTLFEIEIPKELIDKAFGDVYGEISKVSNIPGFRVGKAPLEMVKKHYGSVAKEEVLKKLIPEAYRKAVSDHKIAPMGVPEISDVVFEEDKPISFKAKVDTRPKFKLKDYKGIKIEKKKLEVKEDDVAKTLESLREMNARYASVEDRPVTMGDYIVSDLECLIDGKPAHKKRENLWIYLDKDSLVPELHEKMVGMQRGDERDIDVTIPQNYPDKVMAGKAARYHVKVKEIKTRALPELTDDFAKDLGKTNLEEARKEIRSELEKRMRVNVEVDMENQLLEKLTEMNTFSVPSGLVAKQLSYMVEDAKERLLQKGFKKEDLDKKDKDFGEKLKPDAVKRVRLLFILNEIAALEKIEALDADLKEAYRIISVQTGKGEEEVKAHYEKEGLVEDLREKLKEEKTIRFLMENAKIEEKT
jgi:trigger factor